MPMKPIQDFLKSLKNNSLTVFLKIGNYYISQVIKLTVKHCFSSLGYVISGMCLFL